MAFQAGAVASGTISNGLDHALQGLHDVELLGEQRMSWNGPSLPLRAAIKVW